MATDPYPEEEGTLDGDIGPSEERAVILETVDLRAGYGRVPILHGISLEVMEGEFVGILGHNGMGKTTLMKTITGLIRPTGGRILLDGRDVTREPTHKRARAGLGYVPQGRGIFPQLSVHNNLRMGIAAQPVPTDAAVEHILDIFPRLTRLLDRQGGALSGGEQQLLALARCLIGHPDIILLDEPTEGIQPSIVDEIEETLRRLNAERGLTVVLVEQSMDFITSLSDRILLLQKGRIVGEVEGHRWADAELLDEFVGFGDSGNGRRSNGSRGSGSTSAGGIAGNGRSAATRPPPGTVAVFEPGSPAAEAGIRRRTFEAPAPQAPRAGPAETTRPMRKGESIATFTPPPPDGHKPEGLAPSRTAPESLVFGEQPLSVTGESTMPLRAVRETRPAGVAAPAAPYRIDNTPPRIDTRPHPRSSSMTVRRPTLSQLSDIVSGFNMSMSRDRMEEFLELIDGTLNQYDIIDAQPDYLPPVSYPRTPGYRPDSTEDPLNAWYVKTEIRGAPRGPLAGKTVALKDNVCLAGVPMMNGASTLEGYTPDVDATIVTRMLDAGATIMGKVHCEYFCLSGGSHTNATGPCHNPHKMGYSAGGSSSGSGAVVGDGQVDIAIGGDQGGSIRMPASYCGVYGMKATHGLVPYTGVMPIELTLDHTGPMTQNVEDNALCLEVIAGKDGLDPRQYAPRTDKYTTALGRGVRGLKIGIVQEGFGHPSSEREVDEANRAAARLFQSMGAEVDEISIPMHKIGQAIWTPIALEGLTDLMMEGNGFGTNWRGLYVTSLLDHHAHWRAQADDLSDTLKISMFVGEYFLKHYRGHYYAKAQNLSRKLRGAYDAAFERYDLLLMPTTPMKATPLPKPTASLAEYCERAFELLPNTSPFDCTGHPSMSVPCGMAGGLPLGMMLTAKHYNESAIYRAAHAFEQAGDWRDM